MVRRLWNGLAHFRYLAEIAFLANTIDMHGMKRLGGGYLVEHTGREYSAYFQSSLGLGDGFLQYSAETMLI